MNVMKMLTVFLIFRSRIIHPFILSVKSAGPDCECSEANAGAWRK